MKDTRIGEEKKQKHIYEHLSCDLLITSIDQFRGLTCYD